MESGDGQDWQLNKDILACNEYMFENQINCDVTFTFPGQDSSISAHTYMLISRSPVFYAMFAGPARDESGKVKIPDISEDCFKEMLR